jgi:hypothetical protein
MKTLIITIIAAFALSFSPINRVETTNIVALAQLSHLAKIKKLLI